ncbi:MAG TPA: hypothetical protein VF789_29605 [Thermoanaerobaculia bacterium]
MKKVQVVLLFFITANAWAEPLTKVQLLDLLSKGVDPDLILSLVERDCVAFDLDAAVVAELSPKVSTPILKAAIECRGRISVIAQPSGKAGSEEAPQPPLTLRDLKTVTVIPFTVDGNTDSALTSVFSKELAERKPNLKLQDSLSLALHLEGSQAYDSNTPLLSLIKAARASGVDAFFLGIATTYLVMGNPGVRLDVKLVETRQGQVLWSAGGASKGGGLSWQHARGMASRSVLRQLP